MTDKEAARALYKTTLEGVANGSLKTFAPLVSAFSIRDTPMTLDKHYQLLPLYAAQYPEKMLLMVARQLGKTTNVNSSSFIRSSCLPFYHTLMIQPRFEQIQRMNNTIYLPMAQACTICSDFISKFDLERLALKKFKNGSMTLMSNMYVSADKIRGVSGVSLCVIDECVHEDTEVLVVNNDGTEGAKKIKDIVQGDICKSFFAGKVVDSVVVRDASLRGARPCYEVVTESGASIVCTYNHKLPTEIGPKRLCEIVDTNIVRIGNIGPRATRKIESIDICKATSNQSVILSARDTSLEYNREAAMNETLTHVYDWDFSLVSQLDGELFLDPIVSVKPCGVHPVYDIEVEGTHSYILTNGLCSCNCQDINDEFIPIVVETMSASELWASLLMTGTPLTTDTTLGLQWDMSSQAEWVIKCMHCNHYNIPNPNYDLEGMIGKSGCVCAKCGKDVNPVNGYYVHAIPGRQFTFPGYHVSQTIHPLHCMNPRKWMDLLGKVNSYTPQKLFNEVFGWPYDISVMPLTRSDVLNSRNKHNHADYTDIHEQDLAPYRYISIGIDFDGGGAISMSYTNVAVCGLRRNSNVIDCIYCKRFPKGRRAKEVADVIMNIANRVNPDVIAYDAGGAGFVYRQILADQGMEQIFTMPFKYSSPSSGDVIKFHKGNRDDNSYYYSIDKSRSLAVIIEAVKNAAVTNPWFSDNDPDPVPMELLSLVEQPKETASGGIIYLIGRKSSAPDDYAHALNFACSAIWDHFRSYPKLGVRYDITSDDPEYGSEHQVNNDIWDDPSAWDEFANATNGPLYTSGGFL